MSAVGTSSKGRNTLSGGTKTENNVSALGPPPSERQKNAAVAGNQSGKGGSSKKRQVTINDGDHDQPPSSSSGNRYKWRKNKGMQNRLLFRQFVRKPMHDFDKSSQNPAKGDADEATATGSNDQAAENSAESSVNEGDSTGDDAKSTSGSTVKNEDVTTNATTAKKSSSGRRGSALKRDGYRVEIWEGPLWTKPKSQKSSDSNKSETVSDDGDKEKLEGENDEEELDKDEETEEAEAKIKKASNKDKTELSAKTHPWVFISVLPNNRAANQRATAAKTEENDEKETTTDTDEKPEAPTDEPAKPLSALAKATQLASSGSPLAFPVAMCERLTKELIKARVTVANTDSTIKASSAGDDNDKNTVEQNGHDENKLSKQDKAGLVTTDPLVSGVKYNLAKISPMRLVCHGANRILDIGVFKTSDSTLAKATSFGDAEIDATKTSSGGEKKIVVYLRSRPIKTDMIATSKTGAPHMKKVYKSETCIELKEEFVGRLISILQDIATRYRAVAGRPAIRALFCPSGIRKFFFNVYATPWGSRLFISQVTNFNRIRIGVPLESLVDFRDRLTGLINTMGLISSSSFRQGGEFTSRQQSGACDTYENNELDELKGASEQDEDNSEYDDELSEYDEYIEDEDDVWNEEELNDEENFGDNSGAAGDDDKAQGKHHIRSVAVPLSAFSFGFGSSRTNRRRRRYQTRRGLPGRRAFLKNKYGGVASQRITKANFGRGEQWNGRSSGYPPMMFTNGPGMMQNADNDPALQKRRRHQVKQMGANGGNMPQHMPMMPNGGAPWLGPPSGYMYPNLGMMGGPHSGMPGSAKDRMCGGAQNMMMMPMQMPLGYPHQGGMHGPPMDAGHFATTDRLRRSKKNKKAQGGGGGATTQSNNKETVEDKNDEINGTETGEKAKKGSGGSLRRKSSRGKSKREAIEKQNGEYLNGNTETA